MNKNILLFDIDYTLFDTDSFRVETYPHLMDILKQEDTPKFHLQIKQAELCLREKGGFGPVTFAKLLADMLQIAPEEEKLEELFYNNNLYKKCLYPEVKEVLTSLLRKKDITLGIISTGELSFQERKIASIRHFFHKEMIHIYTNKMDHIQELLTRYKANKLFVVDDSLAFLDSLKYADNSVTTVFIKREKKHKENMFSYAHQPDVTIANLTEIISLLDKKII